MNRVDLVKAFAKGWILDVGCGDAVFVWGRSPPKNVVCVDIEVYRHTHVRLDANMLPFRDNSFDTVLLMEVLEHVDDVERVLKEALRVAKDVVLVSYPFEDRELFVKNNYPRWVRDFIEDEKKEGLKETFSDEKLLEKIHTHWKDKERILRDIEIIRKYCEKEFSLDYGLYPGWGFVCYKEKAPGKAQEDFSKYLMNTFVLNTH
jgi:ubiquinone/menaquinone biosynthesis C-methylase UbiE